MSPHVPIGAFSCAFFCRIFRNNAVALCHALLLFPLLLASSLSLAAPCKEDDAGSLTCNKGDPGVAPSTGARRHVGNPVDVVSGHKQQREVDFQAAGSPLHLSRYYHSAQTDTNVGLGQGWRHSYSLKLYAVGDQRLRISQADGRWIEFVQIDSDDSSAVFMANAVDEGYVIKDEKFVWNLPGGKSVQFTGSLPTRINFPKRIDGTRLGAELQLFYKNNRLATVTDDQHRQLKFEYHASAAELPKFQQSPTDVRAGLSHAGHLSAVVLPSGERIRYEYDAKKNLTKVKLDGIGVQHYGYANSVYPNNLTYFKTQNNDQILERGWTYHDDGKVIEHQAHNPKKSFSIEYGNSVTGMDAGETLVSYALGRQERYRWKKSGADQSSAVVELLARDCESCKQLRFTPAPAQPQATADVLAQINRQTIQSNAAASASTPATSSATSSAISLTRKATTLQAASGFEPPTAEALKPIPGSLDQQLQLTVDGARYQFTVRMTRQGEVADISVGNTSIEQLKRQWRNGTMEVCDTDPVLQRSAIDPPPTMACLEDLMYLVTLADQIEDLSGEFYAPPSSSSARSGFSAPAPEDCLTNPFASCAELERNYEMAQLSACAYVDALTHCGDNWEAVSPATLGLTTDFFDLDSFSATLFFNPKTNEYVLAFRGSDNLGDWKDNLLQAGGISTSQYRKAVALANTLEQALGAYPPNDAQLSFTGHSLGGGLATAAALAIGAEASVFNPAALNPTTADELGLNITHADQLVDVTTVDGDLLTAIQEPNSDSVLDMPRAPGEHTVIGAPDDQWIEDQKPKYPWIARNDGVILHSIDAVLETEEHLLQELCGTTPSRA